MILANELFLYVSFSVNFQLIAAMNPCLCGNFGDPQKPVCARLLSLPNTKKRISDPLLNRIDIHIEVPRVDYDKLNGDRVGETTATIRARVQVARDIQSKSFSKNGSSDIICNAEMHVGEILQFCTLQDEGQSRCGQ